MRKYIYLFSFLVFFQFVFGQKSVDVQISKKQVEVGEDFVVQYNIHNIAAKDFKPPVFGELQLVGGPQQSSSTNIRLREWLHEARRDIITHVLF